jgi:hypothetical protein
LDGKKIGEISPTAFGGEADPPILFKAKVLARDAKTHFLP